MAGCPACRPPRRRPRFAQWARAHGFDVSDRGRLPADVRAAWEAARGALSIPTQASGAPATSEAAEHRLATLEERFTLADERLHALEEHVDHLTVRITEHEGKRKRAALLRRRVARG